MVQKYPAKTSIPTTEMQKKQRSKFAEAVAYAKAINNDPVRKGEYKNKVKAGQTVYHYALREYMQTS